MVRQWAHVNKRHDNAQFRYWLVIGFGIAVMVSKATEHHDS